MKLTQHCYGCQRYNGCKGPVDDLSRHLGSKDRRHVMILTEPPTAEEDRLGQLGHDSSGADILEDLCQGIFEGKYTITSRVKCMEGSSVKPKQLAIEESACKEVLLDQIRSLKPAAIIACGTKSLKTLLGSECPNKSTMVETTPYEWKFEDQLIQVFWLPEVAGFNDPKTAIDKLLQRYRVTFEKANLTASRPAVERTPFVGISDKIGLADLVNKSFNCFSFDVENTFSRTDLSKNVIHKKGVKLLTLSITYHDGSDYRSYVCWGKSLEETPLLRKLFWNRDIVAHNIQHDAQIMKLKADVDVFQLCRKYYDTMVMYYLADQNRKKNGLLPLSVDYLNAADWKGSLQSKFVAAQKALELKRKYLSSRIKQINFFIQNQDHIRPHVWFDLYLSGEKPKKLKKALWDSWVAVRDLQCLEAVEATLDSLQAELTLLPAQITSEDFDLLNILDVCEYNATDTLMTHRHFLEILPQLETLEGYTYDQNCLNMVMRFIPLLARISRNGIPLDLPALLDFDKDLERRLEAQIDFLENMEEVQKALDSLIQKKSLKIFSPVQRRSLITPKATDFMIELMSSLDLMQYGKWAPKEEKWKFGKLQFKVILKDLDSNDPRRSVVEALAEARRILDLRSKTTQSWPRFVCEDGRMHPTFKPVVNQNIGYSNSEESGGAQSGRLGAADPNSQQFPKEMVDFVRRFMVAKQGFRFVEIDYTSLEPMLIAIVTDCKRLQEIFASGKDIYLATAEDIFGLEIDWTVPVSELKKTHKKVRDIFKVGFLAWCYGRGKESFARDCGLTMEQTEAFYEKASEVYAEIYAWKETLYSKLDHNEPLVTLSGRRRTFPIDAKLPYQKRLRLLSKARRIAVNFPIQSLGSDICLIMAAEIQDWIDQQGLDHIIRIINVVHDSIWFELHESRLDIIDTLQAIMADKSRLPWKMTVDLKTEVTQGANLGESQDPDEYAKFIKRKLSSPIAA